jgi:sensor domain CHASE-containing protein
MSALITMLLVALLLAAVERTERAHVEADQRAMVLERLSLVRVRLESHLNQVIASARSLALVYATRPEFSEAEFVSMARVAAQDQTSLVNIGLIRGTVLRHVYPLAGSEKAVGLDIRKTPSMWPAFQRMMATRSTIIAGPVALVQGGTGLIVRIPVHRLGPAGVDESDDFLGAVSIPLDADKVFEETGLPELEREFVVAMRGRDASGARGDVFRGDPLTFGRALAQQEIVLPGGSWQIAAYPRNDADVPAGRPAGLQPDAPVAAPGRVRCPPERRQPAPADRAADRAGPDVRDG